MTRKPNAIDRRSPGQIEAAVCDLVTRFHRDAVGRGPGCVTASMQGDRLFVHLQGILTTAESCLVEGDAAPPGAGSDMIRALRDRIVRQAREQLLAALGATIGRRAESLLHDVAPATDEEVFVVGFARDDAPRVRTV